ncbi:MAG: hypothetical protein RSB39_09330 [Oscillospiraceae bacterium]
MINNMKKVIAAFLTLVLILCMVPAAFAASSEAVAAADALNALGLFSGTGIDASGKPIYDLDRAPTRAEAVVMLVRLLGKEDEAKTGGWEMPFKDVDEWAMQYIGFAYTNKLTSGTSETTFGSSSAITATQYITLVLRALGYESGTDFPWDKAWELSDKIGLTDGRYHANSSSFLRGDVAIISNNALTATLKNSSSILRDTLPLQKTQQPQATPAPSEKGVEMGKYPWGAYEAWSHFYKKDGQLYGLENVGSVGTYFSKYIVNGVEGDYIDADLGAASLLAVLCDQVAFQKSDNPNLAWKKDPNGGIKYDYTGEYWDSTDKTAPISRKKTEKTTDNSNPLSPKTIESQLVRHSVNGKSLTVDIDAQTWSIYEPSDKVFTVDGVTCIRRNNSTGVLLNAQELLNFLGIEGTLQLEQDSYGNVIYSVT